MKVLIATAALAGLPILPIPADLFRDDAPEMKPPQPYAEKTVLPGTVPSTTRAISGAWHYGYLQKHAKLESGNTDLMVTVLLTLNQNLTYELIYSAHWDLPSSIAVLPVPIPGAIGQPHLVKGRSVKESGTFYLSGEVLVLEPTDTQMSDVQSTNTGGGRQKIPNEHHTWIVRVKDRGDAQLSIAGRCASYQVDPVCSKTPTVWYSMQRRPKPQSVGAPIPSSR